MRARRFPLFVVGVTVILLLAYAAAGRHSQTVAGAPNPSPARENPLDRLRQAVGGSLHISYHPATGKVRFIGTDGLQAIPRPGAVASTATPEEAARGFLKAYGSLFGLTNPEQELVLMRSQGIGSGRSATRFRQVYRGVPVLGGELLLQLDEARNLLAAAGKVLPEAQVDIAPTIDREIARWQAIELVARDYGLGSDTLIANDPQLWLYNPQLLGWPGRSSTSLVWLAEIRPVTLLPIRELVLIDAHRGSVVLHFNQADASLYRQTFDAGNSSAIPGMLRRSEGQAATGDAEIDLAHDYAGDTYNFYLHVLGRDGLDGRGMSIVSTVRYCAPDSPCPYYNAFWNGSQVLYGQGYVSDDVVAHELTHAVTGFESNLFYYMQSGAINEALSDIFGEFVDLTNGKGNDTDAVRWLHGEDLPQGAIRNLQDPPNPPGACGRPPCNYRQPDRMTSPLYYCGEDDNGGVHYNSGVANKAAYLITDGGTFNGRQVKGIGIPKAAAIFYEAQTNLLTSASDYQDLYDALPQACTNLLSQRGITASDCQQVRNAVEATEMNRQPAMCAAPEATVCPLGGTPVNLFVDDMEDPNSGHWVWGALIGTDAWHYTTGYATSGQYSVLGYDLNTTSDSYFGMASDLVLPAGIPAYLDFQQAFAFEDSDAGGTEKYDGGVIEYSVDGGVSWRDAGPLVTSNGYNGAIYAGPNADNPLAGRQAFTGESSGYISTRLDLGSLAGKNARFRFRIGTNSRNISPAIGWWIDDVRVYICGSTFTIPGTTPESNRIYLPLILASPSR